MVTGSEVQQYLEPPHHVSYQLGRKLAPGIAPDGDSPKAAGPSISRSLPMPLSLAVVLRTGTWSLDPRYLEDKNYRSAKPPSCPKGLSPVPPAAATTLPVPWGAECPEPFSFGGTRKVKCTVSRVLSDEKGVPRNAWVTKRSMYKS